MFSERAIKLIADAKIEQAIIGGEFDHIEGWGQPFEFDCQRHDPNWWVKQKYKTERIEELKRSENQ